MKLWERLYLCVSLAGKVLKAAPELVLVMVLSPAAFASLVVVLNQTIILSTWVAGGLTSAGLSFYQAFPHSRGYVTSIGFLVCNLIVVIFLLSALITFTNLPVQYAAGLAGFFYAVSYCSALYIRVLKFPILSAAMMDFVPYLSLLIFIPFFAIKGALDISWHLPLSFAVTSLLAVIIALSLNGQSKPLEPLGGGAVSLEAVYRYSLPFMAIGGVNVLVARIDTTLVSTLVQAQELVEYTLSVRLATLTTAASFIFLNLWLPDILQSFKDDDYEAAKIGMLKFGKSVLSISLSIALLCACLHFSGVFSYFNFSFSLPIFLVALVLLTIAASGSFSTYILLRRNNFLFCLSASLITASASLGVIFTLRDVISPIFVAAALYGGIATCKVLEFARLMRIMRGNQ